LKYKTIKPNRKEGLFICRLEYRFQLSVFVLKVNLPERRSVGRGVEIKKALMVEGFMIPNL